MTNAAQRLHRAGQSLWLDSINRVMLRSGALARYVSDLAVTGLTSNPTILGHAMAASHDYDTSLDAKLRQGLFGPQDLVYAVAFEDLAEAASLFRAAWEASKGEDGYVSVEVPPDLAYDAPATAALARRLQAMAGFPNLLVKIPGTPQGLTAMEEVVSAGIGVNVTLLFSDAQYLQTAETYLRALERRRARGESLAVPSVASVFISRWDKAADPLLPAPLHGKLGLAVAQKVYGSYRRLLTSDRWRELAEAGARPQRVLWASTSAKGPGIPDTYYVEKLAAPGTIDTIPEKTLLAFADHGRVGEMLEADYAKGVQAVALIAKEGVDVDTLAGVPPAPRCAGVQCRLGRAARRHRREGGRYDSRCAVMGTRRRAWSGNPKSRRFADAVPRWRDRRELRRRFRAVARSLRAEDKQKVTHSLCRLASDHVPVALVGWGHYGGRSVDFADGTHVELAVHEGEWGLWRLRNFSKRRPPYLRLVKPCLRHGWYRLHFFIAGQEDLMVRARVDDYEATDVCFRRADGRRPHGP